MIWKPGGRMTVLCAGKKQSLDRKKQKKKYWTVKGRKHICVNGVAGRSIAAYSWQTKCHRRLLKKFTRNGLIMI